MEIQIALGLIGALFAVCIALIGVIYSSHSKEIAQLRHWRHNSVDPCLRLTGFIDERLKKVERRHEREDDHDDEQQHHHR